MECSLCKKPTNKCCSRCKVRYYCSQTCQKEDYANHVLSCPRRSADILAKNVFQDRMPTNPAVLYEYGFDNCKSSQDRTMLLGMYIGLIKIICSASQVHSWWENVELSLKIKKAYDDGGYTSEYYNWFLRNEHILQGLHKYEEEKSSKIILDKFLSFAKPYLSKHDQAISIDSLSKSKLNVCVLYSGIIQDLYQGLKNETGLTLDFVLVKLGCKIDEFNDAYMSGTVLDLLKRKCNNYSWLSESKIEIFGYNQQIKSVYFLKQYVLCESVDLIPSVKKLITNPKFDSLDLHKACTAGKIFDYVSSILPNEKLKADLFKNP
ncbi:24519_t:CDS:2, partial [Dentiscutata erythropus]